MHFRDIAATAMADGAIGADEILALRQAGWADGTMDPEEAESLFLANEALTQPSAEWTEFFVEALSNFVVHTVEPAGYVDQEMADELVARIDHDGHVAGMTELELLMRVLEIAASVPQSLKDYALKQIEAGIESGEGPTREEEGDTQGVNAAECRMLRRFVFAAGGDRPAAVSRAEAELLFRIKDATLYDNNAPEWRDLFVQGVANYLLGFGGHEPLSAERAAELEAFMSNEGAGIGGFLYSMLTADPSDGFGSLLGDSDDGMDGEDDAAEAARFTPQEQDWLHDRLDADEDLDELEKALLLFIAEETGEVFGMQLKAA